MKMNNKKMSNTKTMSVCRGVISSIAGADKNTVAAVLEMRLKSAGTSAENRLNTIKEILEEQVKATEDFVY